MIGWPGGCVIHGARTAVPTTVNSMHLAAVVAALAVRAHRDHALAQVHADDRVGADELRLLEEPREREAARLAVRVARSP